MRELILRGGPWSAQQQARHSSTIAKATRWRSTTAARHAAGIDLPRALLRGRYMAAAAAMEHTGVPIDVEMLAVAARELDCTSRTS